VLRFSLVLFLTKRVFTKRRVVWNCSGLALLALRERVVSDPQGTLSSWSGADGDVDPCSWFGVECFHGYVVTL